MRTLFDIAGMFQILLIFGVIGFLLGATIVSISTNIIIVMQKRKRGVKTIKLPVLPRQWMLQEAAKKRRENLCGGSSLKPPTHTYKQPAFITFEERLKL